MHESRRAFLLQALQAAAVAGGGVVLPWQRLLAAAGGRRVASPTSGHALRMPPIFTGDSLTAAVSSQELWPGSSTQTLALNGAFLGPTICRRRGSGLSLQLRNQLSEELILHWHGVLAPADMDGHPRHAVGPGMTYGYSFPIMQRAGTHFYHAHTHQLTGKQVYLGLAGFFIVEDGVEQELDLPRGEFDVPLAIQDKRIDANRQLVYAPTMMDAMSGYLGSTILVNGTPEAYLEVRRTLYRLRLLNASNARVYRIGLSDARPFHVIATDGGLIEQPVQATSFYLSPGERVELLVQFSAYAVGQSVTLKSLPFSGGGMGQGAAIDLMRFDIVGDTAVQPGVPGRLGPVERLDPAAAVRSRVFELDMGMMMRPTINGLAFSMSRVDEMVPQHDMEIWEFRNLSNIMHPMHVHGVQFQVLDRNGSTNLAPNDLAWKDTVLVFPNETVRVILRFDAYRGLFLVHCHNLEHEDGGMMLNVDVVQDPASVEQRGRAGYLQAYPNPTAEGTVLRFEPQESLRELRIVDARGAVRGTRFVEPRSGSIELRTADLASGVYWCHLGRQALKLLVLR